MAGYNRPHSSSENNFYNRGAGGGGSGSNQYGNSSNGYINFDQFMSQHNLRNFYNNGSGQSTFYGEHQNQFNSPQPSTSSFYQHQTSSNYPTSQPPSLMDDHNQGGSGSLRNGPYAVTNNTNNNRFDGFTGLNPNANIFTLNATKSRGGDDGDFCPPNPNANIFTLNATENRGGGDFYQGTQFYGNEDELVTALTASQIGAGVRDAPKNGNNVYRRHFSALGKAIYGHDGRKINEPTESNERHYSSEQRRGGSGRTASQYDDDYYSKYNFEQTSAARQEKHEKSNQKTNSSHYQQNPQKRDSQNQQNRKPIDRQSKYSTENKASIERNSKSHLDFKINRNLVPTAELPDSQQVSQREKLINEIESGKLECLVCCESIKPFHSTWSCSNCYHIIHFQCVVKWASSSKSEDGWRCPACQNITKKVPTENYCFCGKQRSPQYNRNDIAHSCGELCSKTDGCPHPCTLLCHPGPCPTCQATVTRHCGCGRSKKTTQCCQTEEFLCDQICDNLLNCEEHRCNEKCHHGKCAECVENVTHRCHCGKDKKEVICTVKNLEESKYSCGKACNRNLSCKVHKCKDICHAGECGICKRSPDIVTSCPCGKVPILPGQRKSCTDQISLCEAICGKPLKCGPPSNPHTCTNKCHNGNCSACVKETAVRCRCGHMDQMVKCKQLLTRADDARCKKRCTKKRNCGKHKCNQECCIDIDHVCPMPCNHSLSCGKHKCDQTCHKGRCAPCYRSSFDELYCECGANVIYPPVPCGTKKPACERTCTRAHPCDHPVQHNCHSAANCPPCMAFTTKYCYGKHEQRKTIPCSQGEFSCGLPCNRPLRCGQHKCIKLCHDDGCEKDGDICKQNCPKPRILCAHSCNSPCHTGECPQTVCREPVEVVCPCGNRKQTKICNDLQNYLQRQAKARMASLMHQDQDGNSVELSDVLISGKSDNNRILECNDECKLLERNRRLDVAFGGTNGSNGASGGGNNDTGTRAPAKYSDFIKSWAKKDVHLVTMIYDKLTELVKLAKENKQRSRSHSFPVMNREKRQLVHEMCEMFGVKSIAYDAEPNRNVVAIATKDTTWFPSMSIFEVVQRESGQRRIPVPNNNAWGVAKR